METITLQDFMKEVNNALKAIIAEFEASRFQMQHTRELAKKYNVNLAHFRGPDLFRECARKQACRNLKAAGQL